MRKFGFVSVFILALFLFGCSPSSHTVTITYHPDGGQLSMDVPVADQAVTAQINSESPQWYPPTPFKLGYTFVNWYLDANFQEVYTSQILKEKKEVSLYARYIESDQDDFYVVSFIAHGGTFTPNQLIERGGFLTQPDDPVMDGYTFQYWTYDVSNSGLTGPVDFEQPVQENMILGAFYTRK